MAHMFRSSEEFHDSREAGLLLAKKLTPHARDPNAIVLGLPRGGVPVAPRETLTELQPVVDEVVCWTTPEPFYAVGVAYEDFSQVGDDEVRALLGQAYTRVPAA